jgi:tetratricopeptide (TPR) repeat protein
MHSLDLYTVGGTVQASDGIYIERSADRELLSLCLHNAFAYILTSRQLGKSSLVVRCAQELGSRGTRSAIVDLTQLGVNVSESEWYLGFLAAVEDALCLETDVTAWWHSHREMGVTQRLVTFFQNVVLHELPGPVVVFVDEIDSTLSLSFTDDFYAAIRSLHNARATKPELQRLSFVLIGVATPTDLISDPRRTPFNIGHRVEVTDFTLEEALPLSEGFGFNEPTPSELLAWILAWTGGHPYLTQRICRSVANVRTPGWSRHDLDSFVSAMYLGVAGQQDHNISFVADMLTSRAPDATAVLSAYRAIRKRHRVVDDPHSSILTHLKLSGIVRNERNHLVVRNRLYQEIFDFDWIAEHLPINWRNVRKQVAIGLIVSFTLAAATWGTETYLRVTALTAKTEELEARESQLRAQGDALRKALTESDSAVTMAIRVQGEYRNAMIKAEQARAEADVALANLAVTHDQLRMHTFRLQADSLVQEASTIANSGDPEEARRLLQRAHTIVRRLPDRRNEIAILRMIGQTYSAVGKEKEARMHFFDALRVARERVDQRGEAETLNVLGGSFLRSGASDSALVYLRQAYTLQNRAGSVAPSRILGEIGRAFLAHAAQDSALYYFQQETRVARQARYAPGELDGLFHTGETLLAMRNYRAAVVDLRAAYLMALRLRSERRGEIAAALSQAFQSLEMPDSAGIYYRKAEDSGMVSQDLLRRIQQIRPITPTPRQSPKENQRPSPPPSG